MHHYSIYGLSVRSDVPLAALPPGGDGSDVAIHQREFDLPPVFHEQTEDALLATQDTTYLRCAVGWFRLHAGREIAMMPSPGLDSGLLARFISGIVFGLLLHQRDEFALHASAIVVGEKVVAFTGESMSGKSALAAALLARGYAFFADDLVPLRFIDGIPIAYPGIPALKLWPDAVVQVMGEDPRKMPFVWPDEEKRLRSLGHSALRSPLPLSRLYVLDDGEANAITPMTPAETVYELARCRYCARLLHGVDTTRQFQQTTVLAQSVPTYRLRRVMSLSRLPELVDLIEDDLKSISQPKLNADSDSSSSG